MEVQPDFKELLELFNANKVEYLVIGGLALAFHGARATQGTWICGSGRMKRMRDEL